MAPSVYSVSSLGDEAGDHESTPRVSNVRLSFREPVEQDPRQDSVNNPQGTESSQRLLRDDDPKIYGRNFTETEYEAPKKHQPWDKPSWYHDWWFSEILGIILSLDSIVAIIAILARYNGRPLPNWPYKITLNSILSVFSTISKVRPHSLPSLDEIGCAPIANTEQTTMLFAAVECIGQAKWLLFQKGPHNLIDFNAIDEGSRGPWGAVKLVLRMRGKAILASIGGLVLIASLAVDPFVQQVLSYPSRSVIMTAHHPPILPSVTNWNSSGDISIFLSGNDPSSALSLAMKATIYDALFNQGAANSTLNINCPTGNCTFDPTDTLGFCSTCNDVATDLTLNCTSSEANGVKDGLLNCTYYLPGNVGLDVQDIITPDDFGSAVSQSNNYKKTTNMSVMALDRFKTLYSAGLEEDPSNDIVIQGGFKPGTSVFQGIPSPLLAFGRVVFNSSSDPIPIIGDKSGRTKPQATECALYWCVQTLNTSVHNGVFSQNTTGTYFNTSALDTPNAFLQPPAGDDEPRSYYIGPLNQIPLVKFLQDTFTGNLSGIYLPGSDKTPEEMQELTEYSSDAVQALTEYSSDAVQALWAIEDLDTFMSSMANRLTDTLRNQKADPAFSKSGSVYVMQTHVLVSWPWLVLPVALVLLSCGLLLASIISSSANRSVLWKNSSLAVLFHGLDSGQRAEHAVYRRELEREAEGMNVQLREDGGGALHFVDAGPVDGHDGSAKSSRLRRRFGAEK